MTETTNKGQSWGDEYWHDGKFLTVRRHCEDQLLKLTTVRNWMDRCDMTLSEAIIRAKK